MSNLMSTASLLQGANAVLGRVQAGATAIVGSQFQHANINIGVPENDTPRIICLRKIFVCIIEDERSKIMKMVRGGFQENACEWITRDPAYIAWLDPNVDASLLWIRGETGTGKTMLAIYLSLQLEKEFERSDKQLVVYQFCGHLPQDRSSPVCVLRNLIWNMCQTWENLYENHVHEDYLRQADHLIMRHSDSALVALWRILSSMLRALPGRTIFFVVDGLDHLASDEKELEVLLRQLTKFFEAGTEESRGQRTRTRLASGPDAIGRSQSAYPERQLASARPRDELSCKVKVILLSRQNPPRCLGRELIKVAHIDLDRNTNPGYARSCQSFVQTQFDSMTENTGIRPEERDAALHAFYQRQDTSFIPLNHFFEQTSAANLARPDIISKFPRQIEELYLCALNVIPDFQRRRAAALMRWAMASLKPLSIAAVSDGLIHTAGPRSQQSYGVAGISQLLDICAVFLALAKDGIWYRHQSAIDFLMSTEWRGPNTRHLEMFYFDELSLHSELAKACIMYVANERNLRDPIDLDRPNFGQQSHLRKHPFLPYAICAWPEHAREANLEPRAYNIPFFHYASKSLQSWWRSYAMSSVRWGWGWLAPRKFGLIHIAARFGLLGLAQHVEYQGLLLGMIDAYDSDLSRPLEYAIRYHRLELVRYLLQKGASLTDKYGDISGLHEAASYGNIQMVDMILKVTGVHVDFPCSEVSFKKVKTWAIVATHPRAIASGIFNPNPNDNLLPADGQKSVSWLGRNIRAVHMAAIAGHEELLRYLVSKGANQSAPTSVGLTPLHLAALRGHTHIVRALIEDWKAYDSLIAFDQQGWTPLHCAASSGNWETVNCLLDYNANTNAVNKKRKTPLHVAMQQAQEDNFDVALLLLCCHASVDAIDHKGRTPLLIAQQRGMVRSVQVLVDFGANVRYVDPRDKEQLSIYERAVKAGQDTIVAILQEGPRSKEELLAHLRADFSDHDPSDTERGSSAALPSANPIYTTAESVPAQGGERQGVYYTFSASSHTQPPSPPNQYVQESDHDEAGGLPCTSEKEVGTNITAPTNDPILERVYDLSLLFHNNIKPICQTFVNDPPTGPSARRRMHATLAERVMKEILEPLDSLEMPQESNTRLLCKDIVDDCNGILDAMDVALVQRRTASNASPTQRDEADASTDAELAGRPAPPAYAPSSSMASLSSTLSSLGISNAATSNKDHLCQAATSPASDSDLCHVAMNATGHSIASQESISQPPSYHSLSPQQTAAASSASQTVLATSTNITSELPSRTSQTSCTTASPGGRSRSLATSVPSRKPLPGSSSATTPAPALTPPPVEREWQGSGSSVPIDQEPPPELPPRRRP